MQEYIFVEKSYVDEYFTCFPLSKKSSQYQLELIGFVWESKDFQSKKGPQNCILKNSNKSLIKHLATHTLNTVPIDLTGVPNQKVFSVGGQCVISLSLRFLYERLGAKAFTSAGLVSWRRLQTLIQSSCICKKAGKKVSFRQVFQVNNMLFQNLPWKKSVNAHAIGVIRRQHFGVSPKSGF